MTEFLNEKERTETLRILFPDVYRKYPKTITQQQAAEISQVDVQTIRKWEQTGSLPFVPAVDRLLHYHQIRLDDLLALLYSKRCLHDPQSIYMVMLRQFYVQKYRDYPEALLIRDVIEMTGYVKTTVVNWMNHDWLKGYNRGRVYRIPKRYLINFVCGPYYRQIIRKSKVQRADMQSFLEIYQESKEASSCQNISLNSSKSWSTHDAGFTGNL